LTRSSTTPSGDHQGHLRVDGRLSRTCSPRRGLLATAVALWHDAPAVAYAVAFGLAAGQAFFGTACQSLLPSLATDDELVAADSGIWTAAVTAKVLVAPLAALLAVNVGFGAAFGVDAASFGVSGLVLTGLREPGRVATVSVSSPFAHAREGLAALAALPLLKALAVGQLLAAVSAGATSALLVVLAQDRLGGGYGLLVEPSGRCSSVAHGDLLLEPPTAAVPVLLATCLASGHSQGGELR
jgi:hypothetical protein